MDPTKGLQFGMTRQLKNKFEQMPEVRQQVELALNRFLKDDWGDISDADKEENRKSKQADGDYVLGKYPDEIIVLRQYENVTVMLASEY